VTAEPLPLKGLPKPRICKVCEKLPDAEKPKGHPLKAPHEGPRCHRHNIEFRRATKARKHENKSAGTYGMPPGFFRRLLEFQGHRCGGCGRKLLHPQRDHDHKIADPQKAIRGALCRGCNNYLGSIADSEEALLRLLRYLRDPPAQRLMMAWTDDEEATS
jgi:hypothetical protein